MSSVDIDGLAQIVWNYLCVGERPVKAECMLVMGSYDQRIPEYAAKIHRFAQWVVFSGKWGNQTKGRFRITEAERFARIAVRKGLPKEKVLIENQATNTGENVAFSIELLKRKNIKGFKVLLVHKPHMTRRALATFRKLWPERRCAVTSPPIAFRDYPGQGIGKDDLINIIVGDFQRIILYPEKGFQIFQPFNQDVLSAYNTLVQQGYDQNLLKCQAHVGNSTTAPSIRSDTRPIAKPMIDDG